MTESLAMEAGRYVALELTGYDACYAAMAKGFEGCWLTFDQKAHRLIEFEKISCFIDDPQPEGWLDL
jgi:predicted nucleic acid-binding protein